MRHAQTHRTRTVFLYQNLVGNAILEKDFFQSTLGALLTVAKSFGGGASSNHFEFGRFALDLSRKPTDLVTEGGIRQTNDPSNGIIFSCNLLVGELVSMIELTVELVDSRGWFDDSSDGGSTGRVEECLL